MLDVHGQLIYLGKAKDLRTRLLSYFRSGSRPRKAGKIIAQATAILWEVCPGEFASLLRELELIRRWRPKLNVQGQPLRRRQTFLCLGRPPAPHAFLATDPPRTARWVHGPIPAGLRAMEAVRRLNDAFGLRDCPSAVEMIFPDQPDLFCSPLAPREECHPLAEREGYLREPGCLRMELGTCLGPCTGTCTRDSYHAQVRQAQAFLAGHHEGPLPALLADMTAAAAAEDFERAAALRDRLTPLEWLAARLAKLRQARDKLSFIYPQAAADGSQTWYLIDGARTLAAVPAPTDETSREAAKKAIDAVYGPRRSGAVREAYEHIDGMMLVLGWFRKYPKELKRTLAPHTVLG
jgi:excinuclease ABC subunit C